MLFVEKCMLKYRRPHGTAIIENGAKKKMETQEVLSRLEGTKNIWLTAIATYCKLFGDD